MHKKISFLAVFGLFSAIFAFSGTAAHAVDNQDPSVLPAGFYQFNNLEILKSPTTDEPPASIEAIQKNDPSCSVYENGKADQPVPCVFNGDGNNNLTIQVDERTTILGANQESALVTDFQSGNKINVLGWLSADGKTIRAATIRDLENKNYHQSLSGTIKSVTDSGFTITLDNGNEISVKTPIVEGAQVTIKGVFDQVKNEVSDVLSIIVKPVITLQQPQPATPAAPAPAPAAPVKPSTLFRNFLKIFGL